ncbi:MAG: hypothetical protein HY761_04225 [Candidatus Omnitrophica bacterium]|nr:hypothetical protein [Candidatus Omnitrophota bacterium]
MRLNHLLITIILSLIIVLVGCFQPAYHKITPEKVASIKKVTAVSLLGDKIRKRYQGTTIFNNDLTISDVADWKIDEFLEQQVRELIDYDYISINANHDTLMNIYTTKELYCCFSREYDFNRIKNEIEETRKDFGVDTIIFILEDHFGAPNNRPRPGFLAGYGIYQGTEMLLFTETFIYAYAQVVVFNTDKFEVLGASSFVLKRGVRDPYYGYGGDQNEKVDNIYWNIESFGIESSERKFIENTIKGKLTQRLYNTLSRLGFDFKESIH